MRKYVFILGMVLPAVLPAADLPVVRAPTAPCTMITAVPSTISTPGNYCLGADLVSANGAGILIQSSHVSLDCRSHWITQQVRDIGGYGIAVDPNVRNVAIRNCRLKNFDSGISAGFPVTSLQILNNRIEEAFSVGIQAAGHRARVIGNQVINTHNIPGQQSIGISIGPHNLGLPSVGVVVQNNVVASVKSDVMPFGIMVAGSSSPQLISNRILDLQPASGNSGLSIYLAQFQSVDTTNAQLINNTMMARVPLVQGVYSVGAVTAACVGNISMHMWHSGFSSSCRTSVRNSEGF
jgi:hypothetical protein